MFDKTDSLAGAGQTDSAVVIYREALAAAESEFARSDTTAELTLYLEGRPRPVFFAGFSEADSLYLRALSTAERVFGPDHVAVAEILDRLVQLYRMISRDAEAKLLAERAVAIAEGALGPDHPLVAEYLDRLGLIEYWLDHNDLAEVHYKRAITIAEKSLGPDHPQVGVSLLNLANLSRFLGRLEEADSLYQQSLAIREKVYGPDHLEVAAALEVGGRIYSGMGDNQAAVDLLLRVVATFEESPIVSSTTLGYAFDRLGSCYTGLGRFREELIARERALRLLSDDLGDTHPDALRVASAVAMAKMRLGRYAEAESDYRNLLRKTEAAFGPDHGSLVNMLGQLAMVCQEQGRLAEAESLCLRSVSIGEKATGQIHIDRAHSVLNLGIVYHHSGLLDQAESSFKDARDIWHEAYGPEVLFLTYVYLNLGMVYDDQGRYAEADSILQLSIDIAEKKLGPQHPALAHALNNQANLYVRLGRYAEAEASQLRAISILEEALGSGHPEAAKFRRDLGRLYAWAGDVSSSLDAYGQFIDFSQHFLENVFPYSSEEQRLRWIGQYPLVDETMYSVALQGGGERSLRQALEMLLKSKGMVLESVMGERQTAYCVYDDVLRARIEEHNDLCTEIANLSIAGVAYLDTLKVLYRQKDSLEVQLSLHCSEFGDELAARRFEVADIAAAIPSGSVLWEYVRFHPTDLSKDVPGDKKVGRPRYMAFALDHGGTITAKDLGPADEIDSLVVLARSMIYRAQVQVYSPAASQAEARLNEVTGRLRELLFTPLASTIGGSGEIYISPDGPMNLLPFEILPLADGSYAVESYRLSYVSSGRDFMRHRGSSVADGEILLLADADFDGTGSVPPKAEPMFDTTEVYGPQLRGIADCMSRRFSRLSHSRREADSVAARFRSAGRSHIRECYQSMASEEVLKALEAAPSVVHLATHGFFCESADSVPVTVRDNPLLRSGLALTGANRSFSGDSATTSGEDGILTALEVSGLNLVGTELTVLSACESGLGDLVSGEGVFGLRRAFQHAGVRTVVMSLWAVPDRETSLLMDGFYRRWLSGMGKRDALRESALEVLRMLREQRGSGHPLLWGGFILTGNPN